MGQSDLANYGGGSKDTNVDRGFSRRIMALKRAPDNAEPAADDSCPFCLAPSSDFEPARSDSIDKPYCTNCKGLIPVDQDWYQRGEKVCFDTI